MTPRWDTEPRALIVGDMTTNGGTRRNLSSNGDTYSSGKVSGRSAARLRREAEDAQWGTIQCGSVFCVFVEHEEQAEVAGSSAPSGYTYSIYSIESFDANDANRIYARDLDTGEERTFSLYQLLRMPAPSPGKSTTSRDDAGAKLPAPIFARTTGELLERIEALHPPAEPLASTDLRPSLLARAERIVAIVERVSSLLKEAERQAKQQRVKFSHTAALREAISRLNEEGEVLSRSSYYDYLKLFTRHRGNVANIAISLRRSTYKRLKTTDAQLHFVDSVLIRFGRMRKKELYNITRSTWRRTGGRWVCPQRCTTAPREEFVDKLFNNDIPMSDLLANPEYAPLLTPIKLPSRSWFYKHHDWFAHLPGCGEEMVKQRYGAEMWEHNFLLFDTFVQIASLPGQYVFADHHLLDVFGVDDENRRRVGRLWLTLFIDAWSRAIVGFTLRAEDPSIESILSGLMHTIWPKYPQRELLRLYSKGIGSNEADTPCERRVTSYGSVTGNSRNCDFAGQHGYDDDEADASREAEALFNSIRHLPDLGIKGSSLNLLKLPALAALSWSRNAATASGVSGTGDGVDTGQANDTESTLGELANFGSFESLMYLPLSAYCIPHYLLLDNAWAHHSHSLKETARLISNNGEYPNINLLFRPPYKARMGALVERLFGNLSAQIKELLRHAGAIQSSHPKDVRQAAMDSCLLFEDVYFIVYLLILAYQHTPHGELGGMTPHNKWLSGMKSIRPLVPPLDANMERHFWHLHPSTRVVTREGIALFNLHYTWDPRSRAARMLPYRQHTGISKHTAAAGGGGDTPYAGERVAGASQLQVGDRCAVRYQKQDISRIAIFKDGVWLGDMYAKKLRLPDGSYRAVSLWKWEAVKRQANSVAAALDLLGLTTAVEKLVEERREEQVAVGRRQRRGLKQPRKQGQKAPGVGSKRDRPGRAGGQFTSTPGTAQVRGTHTSQEARNRRSDAINDDSAATGAEYYDPTALLAGFLGKQ